ncbi:MAG: glycosyltransferase [Acidimicrobiales bacterium]
MKERVSVVMTTYREPAGRLDRALACVAAQRTGCELEVVLAAGPDDTEVEGALERAGCSDARVVLNRTGRRSEGLNLAIAASSGDIVCRVDARSLVPHDYVERCARRLREDLRVGVVGGFQRPVAGMKGPVAAGVARALGNGYLLGAPAYRRSDGWGPVDTVYLGSWRRTDLDRLGGFDERLAANEDFELCRRFANAGLVVWLEEGLEVPYEARASLREVFLQYHAFGRAKVHYWRTTGERPNRRQALALAAFGSAALAVPSMVRKPRRLAAAAAATGAGLLLTDRLADPTEVEAPVRAAAATAGALVLTGWIAGVAHESLVGRR